jgi:5-methylcytosine-specific restriction protein B
MNIYISQENVTSSINYFKNAGFDSNDMLILFLLSKHMGITTSFPITYGGTLSDAQKAECLNVVWMFGGLFDSTEHCGKRGLIFPTGFSKVEMYNPGTEFSGAVGRVRDTIKQKVNTVPLYNYNEGIITLKSNYKEVVQEYCLKGNKISLSQLAAWLFRYTSFEFDAEPDSKKFTRVVERVIRKFLKVTKNDFLWLFDDDLSTNRLTPARTGVTGEFIRTQFVFENGKSPEVRAAEPDEETQSDFIDRETVERYLTLNGDNPSDSDIFDILKSKKQIVLTGVPGVGKSRYTNILCNNEFFTHKKVIQFHTSYGYEDFIGAEILKSEIGGTYVTTRKGVFLDFANEALSHPEENYLFVIDELNRGNIAEIFGETILALDRDYTVDLSREYEGIKTLQLPDNLYIVGTMNTSDRNIAFLDLAIRRRFAFIPLLPNYDFLSETVVLDGFDLGNVLRTINQRILSTLKDPELILGQSYFIPEKSDNGYVWSFEKFKNQFNFVILPTLREYSFNDRAAVSTIVGENLGDGIQELDEFIAIFTAEFSV